MLKLKNNKLYNQIVMIINNLNNKILMDLSMFIEQLSTKNQKLKLKHKSEEIHNLNKNSNINQRKRKEVQQTNKRIRTSQL